MTTEGVVESSATSAPSGRDRVIVFLKAPRPGSVKTRLAADLDAEAAAAIYSVLVERTLASLVAFSLSRAHSASPLDVELRIAPDDSLSEIAHWVRPDWKVQGQGPGDLGARLERATEKAFSEGARRVVVVGTDCPELAPSDLEAALSALETCQLVLGPADDGGYWLIGMAVREPGLFHDVPWSSAEVLQKTRSRATECGLKWIELRRLRDIDRLEDWREWLKTAPL